MSPWHERRNSCHHMSPVGSCKVKVNTIMKGKGPIEWYSFTLLKKTGGREKEGERERFWFIYWLTLNKLLYCEFIIGICPEEIRNYIFVFLMMSLCFTVLPAVFWLSSCWEAWIVGKEECTDDTLNWNSKIEQSGQSINALLYQSINNQSLIQMPLLSQISELNYLYTQ